MSEMATWVITASTSRVSSFFMTRLLCGKGSGGRFIVTPDLDIRTYRTGDRLSKKNLLPARECADVAAA